MVDLSKKKLVFVDLDDTLIKTASGKTFPRSVADFIIRLDVLKKLRAMGLEMVMIVTNQGGIPKFYSERDFKAKIKAVTIFVNTYVGAITYYRYCTSLDKGDPKRKPNTGMLDDLLVEANCYRKSAGRKPYTKEEIFYVGDASGIHTDERDDYSDDDKKCAENFGVDYVDVEEFVNN